MDATPAGPLPGQSLALLRGVLQAVRRHVDLPTFQAIARDVPAAVLHELVAARDVEHQHLLHRLVVELVQLEER